MWKIVLSNLSIWVGFFLLGLVVIVGVGWFFNRVAEMMGG